MFPLIGEPGEWDELTLLAATVALEAEAEPPEGQLAVAWVAKNRDQAWNLTLHQVLLGPEGKAYGDGKSYEPYSCWNDDYRMRAQTRLSALGAYEPAWKAAAAAQWHLQADPSNGATFYLNPDLTRRIRGGSLPTWFDERKVTAVIGRHTFLRV
jgi:spore germination cell wall hydrolase CwlJ-like protein